MSIRKLLSSGAEIDSAFANVGLALLRMFSGLALAFGHGIAKIPPSEGFIEGVRNLGFPVAAFFAWAAASSEFFGGLLLAAGLLTRPAAFFILITMSVAAVLWHAADPFGVKEKALLFAFIALAFVLIGSGKYGIDSVFRRRKKT
jgi:putative oxidoreductase